MKNRMRSTLLAAATIVAVLGPAVAQDTGATLYKAKCQACHGADGMASAGVGKVLKVKPIGDPEVKSMTEAQMIAAVRNGSGKMQPYKNSLTDAQIKDSVEYFRTFLK